MAKPPAKCALPEAGELLASICPAKLPPVSKTVLLSAFRSGTASRIGLARALRLVSALMSGLDLVSALEVVSVSAAVSVPERKSGEVSMLAGEVARELVSALEATK